MQWPTRYAIVLAVVVLLLVAYVLSVAPAYWLVKQDYVSNAAVIAFYSPLIAVAKFTGTIKALVWYMNLGYGTT